MITLLAESSSVVNHTPLSEVSCDPCEPFPVSPATLLQMREYQDDDEQLQDFDEDDLLSYGKKRWRRVQYLADQFFIRWKNEYIAELQTRKKWKYPSRNLREGDVVVIKDVTSRNKWPMGLVSKTIISEDGLVRRAILRVHSTSSKKPQYRERAVHDLVLLVPVC